MIYHWISKEGYATCLLGSEDGIITLAAPILYKKTMGKNAKEILYDLKSKDNKWRGCDIVSFCLISERS